MNTYDSKVNIFPVSMTCPPACEVVEQLFSLTLPDGRLKLWLADALYTDEVCLDVATIGNPIIGWAALCGNIWNFGTELGVFVNPAYRNCGVGTKLLLSLFKRYPEVKVRMYPDQDNCEFFRKFEQHRFFRL